MLPVSFDPLLVDDGAGNFGGYVVNIHAEVQVVKNDLYCYVGRVPIFDLPTPWETFKFVVGNIADETAIFEDPQNVFPPQLFGAGFVSFCSGNFSGVAPDVV